MGRPGLQSPQTFPHYGAEVEGPSAAFSGACQATPSLCRRLQNQRPPCGLFQMRAVLIGRLTRVAFQARPTFLSTDSHCEGRFAYPQAKIIGYISTVKVSQHSHWNLEQCTRILCCDTGFWIVPAGVRRYRLPKCRVWQVSFCCGCQGTESFCWLRLLCEFRGQHS
jgi:hypothetical protein